MRICFLTDQALDSGPLPAGDYPCDPRPYLPDEEWTLATLVKPTSVRQLIELHQEGFDVFFNLCDGAWDEDRPGIEVVETLERLNVPYTGATPVFYEPSREVMKRVCHAWGIDTPRYVVVRGPGDVERAADTLRFPLIVKHPSSYASTGLTRASRVENAGDLATQVGIMVAAYGGALIEEFIEGTECTVLVAENPEDPGQPITYAPLRYRFPEGESFKHYDLKWVDYHGLESFSVDEAALEARLRDVSARFFLGLDGAGYGRCDLRVDDDGRAFMLEINPNCGVYYPPTDPGSADLILANDPAGHPGFTRQVVEAALARHRRKQLPWEVRYQPCSGYGLYAARSIREGETIIEFEERAHELVTRTHVERSWKEPHLSWFRAYAWPLTDEVRVIWSRDPRKWKPVNHSCDPTAWLEGLDVVARKDLRSGEEITLDYGTFYDELMDPFECSCGVAECRGTIRGDDYRLEVMERYGDHLSDHIRRKRRAALG